MRAVIQRVNFGQVTVADEKVGTINDGFVLLLGVGREDTQVDIDYLVDKTINLRIFEDADGKINLSLQDVGGQVLVVSQFTLYADCRKGRRPGFSDAAPPAMAREYYEKFVQTMRDKGVTVATGQFQANMLVEIHNSGPVTILLDSKKCF